MPGTAKKLKPNEKRCCDCRKVKHKFKDFRSRWNRCEKHKEQGLAKDDPKVLKCAACEERRSATIRQPRCVECDAKRRKKDQKGKKPAKVTAKKKAAKTSQSAPAVTVPPQETAPIAATAPPPAPAPVHHTAPPASPPAPSGVVSSLAAVDSLLGEQKGETADSAGPAGSAVAVSPSGKKKPAMGEAPQSAFRGPPAQGPTLIRRGTKGCKQGRHYIQTNMTEIKRILFALTTREKRVAQAERRLNAANDRFRKYVSSAKESGGLDKITPELKARYESAHEAREHEIARVNNARAWRAFTAKKLRLFLDHALTHTPYAGAPKPCPTGPCEACNQTGLVRAENRNPYAKAAVPILRHILSVLEITELCFKIRAQTSERDDAFNTLLKGHMGLVKKFGNPHQTAMEGDDAEQGAMMGLLDGARRYDPTKPIRYICPGVNRESRKPCGYKEEAEKKLGSACTDCQTLGHRCEFHQSAQGKTCPKCGKKLMVQTSVAGFQTVAWSWARRNSRARKTTDERPGLRPSIDDPGLGGKKAEDGGIADQVAMIDGRARIADGSTKLDEAETAALDLHSQIALLDDPQQKEIMRLCLEGITSPSEIGKKLDLTTRQVIKAKDAACAILRERLAGYLERERTPVEQEV